MVLLALERRRVLPVSSPAKTGRGINCQRDMQKAKEQRRSLNRYYAACGRRVDGLSRYDQRFHSTLPRAFKNNFG
jgi:hypothetical protein